MVWSKGVGEPRISTCSPYRHTPHTTDSASWSHRRGCPRLRCRIPYTWLERSVAIAQVISLQFLDIVTLLARSQPPALPVESSALSGMTLGGNVARPLQVRLKAYWTLRRAVGVSNAISRLGETSEGD